MFYRHWSNHIFVAASVLFIIIPVSFAVTTFVALSAGLMSFGIMAFALLPITIFPGAQMPFVLLLFVLKDRIRSQEMSILTTLPMGPIPE